MKNLITILLSLFTISSSIAQDVNYALNIVNVLSSEKYHGRGYVKRGDAKAAKYIAKQFKTNGVAKFGKNYFQKYSFPINTFPNILSVSIDGNELIPGKDYVVSLSAK